MDGSCLTSNSTDAEVACASGTLTRRDYAMKYGPVIVPDDVAKQLGIPRRPMRPANLAIGSRQNVFGINESQRRDSPFSPIIDSGVGGDADIERKWKQHVAEEAEQRDWRLKTVTCTELNTPPCPNDDHDSSLSQMCPMDHSTVRSLDAIEPAGLPSTTGAKTPTDIPAIESSTTMTTSSNEGDQIDDASSLNALTRAMARRRRVNLDWPRASSSIPGLPYSPILPTGAQGVRKIQRADAIIASQVVAIGFDRDQPAKLAPTFDSQEVVGRTSSSFVPEEREKLPKTTELATEDIPLPVGIVPTVDESTTESLEINADAAIALALSEAMDDVVP